MVNLFKFLEDREIFFDSQSQAIGWIRRNLKPKTMFRVGENYLMDKNELEQSLSDYLVKQKKIYQQKVERATNLRNRRKKLNSSS